LRKAKGGGTGRNANWGNGRASDSWELKILKKGKGKGGEGEALIYHNFLMKIIGLVCLQFRILNY
jgi:hypothetical protein